MGITNTSRVLPKDKLPANEATVVRFINTDGSVYFLITQVNATQESNVILSEKQTSDMLEFLSGHVATSEGGGQS